MEFKAIIKDRLRYRRRRYNATDEGALEDTLLSKNIAVVELNQCQKERKFRRVGKKYLLQFFAKLRICYAIDMPILDSLELCENVIPNKNLKQTIKEIRQQVASGVEISACLWRYPNIFPPVICRLVEVGYRSGKMKEACDKIFYMLNLGLQMRRKIISAMYYPAMVTVALIFAVYILITKTIPTFTQLFTGAGIQLPLPTRLLVQITDALTYSPWATLGGVIGIIACILLIPKVYAKSYIAQRSALHIFPFGGLLKYSQRLTFISTLYTILSAQVPMIQALRMTRNAVGNIKFKDAVISAIMSVNSGQGISQGLDKHSELLTPELVKSLKFAEETGATVQILESLQKEYEEGLEYQINLFKEAIQPIITIILAVVVLFILLALFLPMFSMTQVITK